MLHIHVYNPLQKIFELFQKILQTSIINESIKFLVKKYLREVISKILLYTMEENESPIKAMFFDRSFFFKRNSVNSLISICLSDLKDQKLPDMR